MHIILTVLNAFPEMLTRRICFTDQKLLLLVIISFILMALMCDSGLILQGEIRCWSLLGVKGLSCSVGAEQKRCAPSLRWVYKWIKKIFWVRTPANSFHHSVWMVYQQIYREPVTESGHMLYPQLGTRLSLLALKIWDKSERGLLRESGTNYNRCQTRSKPLTGSRFLRLHTCEERLVPKN